MKILFISPRYEGGIGGHAFRVAEKLRQVGFKVRLMHVPHIPVKNLKNPSFAVFGMAKAVFEREHYDVVHAWNVPSAFVMRYVKADKKVLSVHGVYSQQVDAIHSGTTSSLVSMTEQKILGLADVLTTDSKSVQRAYKEKFGLEFVYLPAPVDAEKLDQIPPVAKIESQVAYVGRNSYEKGVDVLKSAEARICGRVLYCTSMPWEEAMAALKASAVLAIPSRMESLPQTIKEAFYLRVPVVATRVGDIPDVVQHGKTGILVEPQDVDGLAGGINLLLGDKKLASEIAESAYEFVVKNFTWDVLLSKYVEFYEKL